MELSLQGHWALVGGASQGIGQATARILSAQGARVILMSRRSEVLEQVKATLTNPSLHRTLALDLERLEDISLMLGRLVADLGPVSIWVNNTGGPKAGPLSEASPDEMERAFRGHVLSSQVILRTLLPGMKTAGYGRIINVLSTSVKVPIPNLGVSNTIRAAMASWAKTLSQEVGQYGITVNNILPGFIETPRLDSLASGAAAKSSKTEAEIRKEWADQVPMRRLGDPNETAQAIAFLASPAAGYISGVHLPVDGGRTGAL
ncbi:MAG: SDR family oxidoreductase [Bdellovibrionaceae bacterium]|nr:SDR family oxidoreductase [Pseudobdellovibrionaceae bacterium]